LCSGYKNPETKNQNLILDKKNPELKIIHSGKNYPEKIIVFWKRGSGM